MCPRVRARVRVRVLSRCYAIVYVHVHMPIIPLPIITTPPLHYDIVVPRPGVGGVIYCSGERAVKCVASGA